MNKINKIRYELDNRLDEKKNKQIIEYISNEIECNEHIETYSELKDKIRIYLRKKKNSELIEISEKIKLQNYMLRELDVYNVFGIHLGILSLIVSIISICLSENLRYKMLLSVDFILILLLLSVHAIYVYTSNKTSYYYFILDELERELKRRGLIK